MRAVLIAIGSAGDVFPFLGLGLELKRRGHDVSVISNGYFESAVRQTGMQYIEFGSREEYLRITQNAELWHPLRGFKTVMSYLPPQEMLYDIIMRQHQAGAAVFVASSLAFAARTAQDKHSLPVVSVHLSPILIRSVHQTPVGPGRFDASRLPMWMKRSLLWMADRWVLDAGAGPTINAHRATLGLPPVEGIFKHWMHSPLLTIGLFPDWFGPPQPDWPKQVRLTGFPLFDLRGQAGIPQQLEDFLRSGPPPIVATPGPLPP